MLLQCPQNHWGLNNTRQIFKGNINLQSSEIFPSIFVGSFSTDSNVQNSKQGSTVLETICSLVCSVWDNVTSVSIHVGGDALKTLSAVWEEKVVVHIRSLNINVCCSLIHHWGCLPWSNFATRLDKRCNSFATELKDSLSLRDAFLIYWEEALFSVSSFFLLLSKISMISKFNSNGILNSTVQPWNTGSCGGETSLSQHKAKNISPLHKFFSEKWKYFCAYMGSCGFWPANFSVQHPFKSVGLAHPSLRDCFAAISVSSSRQCTCFLASPDQKVVLQKSV